MLAIALLLAQAAMYYFLLGAMGLWQLLIVVQALTPDTTRHLYCRYFLLGAASSGLFFLLFAGIMCCWAKCVLPRVPFAAAIVGEASTVVTLHPGLLAVSLGGVAAQLGWIFVWFFAYVGITHSSSSGGGGAPSYAPLLLMLCFFWGAQVCLRAKVM